MLPELPALRLEIDEHHRHKDVYEHSLTVLEQAIALEDRRRPESVPGPDLVLRLAALLHDIGKPPTRRFEAGGGVSFHHHEVVGAKLAAKRLKAMRYDKDTVKAVVPAGRAAPALPRLRRWRVDRLGGAPLRHRRRAAAGAAAPADPLRLHDPQRARPSGCPARTTSWSAGSRGCQARRSWPRSGPSWTATQIAEVLGISPGPVLGRAYKFLLSVRMDQGPIGPEAATEALREWWATQPESAST